MSSRSVADVSVVPEGARAYQGGRAGFVTRAIANSVDFLLVVFVLVAIYMGATLFLFLWNPRTFHFPTPSATLITVVSTVFATLYFAVEWMTSGRTYGDQLLGLRVVARSGRRLSPGWSLLRAALCVLFPIGLVWSAVSRERRCIQDLVLRTSVIYDWPKR